MRFFVNWDSRWFAWGRYDLRETDNGLVYYIVALGFCLNLARNHKQPGAGSET